MKSFNLSIKNYDIESNRTSTHQRDESRRERIPDIAPGLFLEDESGLITSDSDFDQAEKTAGYIGLPQISIQQHNINPQQSQQVKVDTSNGECRPAGVRKDVYKTFKKLLTSNYHRSSMDSPIKQREKADDT